MAQGQFGVATKAGIIKDGKILVVYKTAKEASHDPDSNARMDLPGGRLEFEERPYSSLRREVREEVNLLVDVVQPAYVWDYVENNFQLVGVTFYCRYRGGEVSLSDEHERYEWLSFDDLVKRGSPDIKEFSAIFRLHALLAGTEGASEP